MLLPHLRESLGTYCSAIEIMGGASWTAVATITNGKAVITTPDIGFCGKESPFPQNRNRLILNGEFDTLLSTLDTFVEHDGSTWTGLAAPNDSVVLGIDVITKGGKFDLDFFKRLKWDRTDDGMTAETCNPMELLMCGKNLEQKVKDYVYNQ
jgi:hypothetical protein